MQGATFCPVCRTNLSRSPKEKMQFSNGRSACFKHLPRYEHIPCDLRVPRPEGMRYETEELAAQAIAHDQLAIVSSFMAVRPEAPEGVADPYDQSAVEDIAGPASEVPISRHGGTQFTLPSRISTVAGMCRRFDKNIYKYYVLPGARTAQLLSSLLHDVTQTDDVDGVARLYWGRIVRSRNAGINPKPTNRRMTELQAGPKVKDFTLKAPAFEQEEKGIGDDSVGRIVLFWGEITVSGIGLCIDRPGWGEYALLPEKYEHLLVG